MYYGSSLDAYAVKVTQLSITGKYYDLPLHNESYGEIKTQFKDDNKKQKSDKTIKDRKK